MHNNRFFFIAPDPKGYVSYCHQFALSSHCLSSSSVNFSTFFSKTSGPVESRFGRNIHWINLYKVSRVTLLGDSGKEVTL